MTFPVERVGLFTRISRVYGATRRVVVGGGASVGAREGRLVAMVTRYQERRPVDLGWDGLCVEMEF